MDLGLKEKTTHPFVWMTSLQSQNCSQKNWSIHLRVKIHKIISIVDMYIGMVG